MFVRLTIRNIALVVGLAALLGAVPKVASAEKIFHSVNVDVQDFGDTNPHALKVRPNGATAFAFHLPSRSKLVIMFSAYCEMNTDNRGEAVYIAIKINQATVPPSGVTGDANASGFCGSDGTANTASDNGGDTHSLVVSKVLPAGTHQISVVAQANGLTGAGNQRYYLRSLSLVAIVGQP